MSPQAAEPDTQIHRRSPLVPLGNVLFRYRNFIFPVTFLLIVLLEPPHYPFHSALGDRLLDVVGILLAVAGQALRVAVIGLAYIHRGGKHGKVYAENLVTTGLFAHSRNPLYVGNIAVFCGLFVVLNSYLGWLVGIPAVFLAYWAIVFAEEDFLRGKFGSAYDQYCEDVNRFLPSLSGLRQTLASMQFDWRRVIRKEYGSTWTWISVVIGLLFWERWSVEGPEAVRPHLPDYLAAWLLVTLFYLTARVLKKTGRLQ